MNDSSKVPLIMPECIIRRPHRIREAGQHELTVERGDLASNSHLNARRVTASYFLRRLEGRSHLIPLC